jgi:RimJ/RimL family protein N-acetyltransferase
MSTNGPDAFRPPPIPRVATARLLLREPRLADFDAYAVTFADPLAGELLGGPGDRREAWRRFHASAGNWLLQGMGWWTVEERATGAVGSVGVFRRETGPELEIGWLIHRAHWGQGYASEAARAALDFVASAWRAERVIAMIAKDNDASMKVATKAGMTREREVDFYGDPYWRYVFVPEDARPTPTELSGA